jgi:hypothetical protein
MRLALCVCIGLCVAGVGSSAQQKVVSSSGAILRVQEKVSGQITDFDMTNGTSQEVERLTIDLQDCRYPEDNPTGEAYAFVIVREGDRADPLFQGWMIASSPALNAMEHPRYDVWVLRCRTP